jgi:RimJ/RimL family protein N-acetyltransferase
MNPEPGEIVLRLATFRDCERFMFWRNDPDAIKMSTTKKSVTKDEHESWFIQALANKRIYLYVAETDVRTEAWQPVDLQPVGMGRINIDRDVAVLSYSVDRDHRGRGYAGEIITQLCLNAYQLGVMRIQAVTRYANRASIRALLQNDFTLPEDKLLLFERKAKS